MTTIAELQLRADNLEAEHRAAVQALNAAKVKASPFSVGQEVEISVGYGKPWTRAQISRMGVKYGNVRIWVRVATKSGWHKTEREVWSFDSIRPLAEATP